MKIRIKKIPTNAELVGSLLAFGGNLGTNSTNFSDGLTYFNVPTRHETNPNGGIPLGIAPDGLPNLVEGKEDPNKKDGGEIKWNKQEYIFSDRLKPTLALIDRWKLPKNYLDYTYADCVRKSPVVKEAEQRPNDPITLDTMDKFLADVAEDQETQKKEKDAVKILEQLSQMSDQELAATGLQMQRQQLEPLELGDQPADYDQLELQSQDEYIQLLQALALMAQLLGMALPQVMSANGGQLFAEGGDAGDELQLGMEPQPEQVNPFEGQEPQGPMLMPLEQMPPLEAPMPLEPQPQELSKEKSPIPDKPAEEMSTKELNETIEFIIQYAKDNKDKALLREAKQVKKKGTREEKEEFVDDTLNEIREELETQEPQESQVPEEPLEEISLEPLQPMSLEAPLEMPLGEPLMMAEGGDMTLELMPTLEQAQQDPQLKIQQTLIDLELLGQSLGLDKDSYTPQEVKQLLKKAEETGIDTSVLLNLDVDLIADALNQLIELQTLDQQQIEESSQEPQITELDLQMGALQTNAMQNQFARGGLKEDGHNFTVPLTGQAENNRKIAEMELLPTIPVTPSPELPPIIVETPNNTTTTTTITDSYNTTNNIFNAYQRPSFADLLREEEALKVENIYDKSKTAINNLKKKEGSAKDLTSEEIALELLRLEVNERLRRGENVFTSPELLALGPRYAGGGSMSLKSNTHVFSGNDSGYFDYQEILNLINSNPSLKEAYNKHGMDAASEIISQLMDIENRSGNSKATGRTVSLLLANIYDSSNSGRVINGAKEDYEALKPELQKRLNELVESSLEARITDIEYEKDREEFYANSDNKNKPYISKEEWIKRRDNNTTQSEEDTNKQESAADRHFRQVEELEKAILKNRDKVRKILTDYYKNRGYNILDFDDNGKKAFEEDVEAIVKKDLTTEREINNELSNNKPNYNLTRLDYKDYKSRKDFTDAFNKNAYLRTYTSKKGYSLITPTKDNMMPIGNVYSLYTEAGPFTYNADDKSYTTGKDKYDLGTLTASNTDLSKYGIYNLEGLKITDVFLNNDEVRKAYQEALKQYYQKLAENGNSSFKDSKSWAHRSLNGQLLKGFVLTLEADNGPNAAKAHALAKLIRANVDKFDTIADDATKIAESQGYKNASTKYKYSGQTNQGNGTNNAREYGQTDSLWGLEHFPYLEALKDHYTANRVGYIDKDGNYIPIIAPDNYDFSKGTKYTERPTDEIGDVTVSNYVIDPSYNRNILDLGNGQYVLVPDSDINQYEKMEKGPYEDETTPGVKGTTNWYKLKTDKKTPEQGATVGVSPWKQALRYAPLFNRPFLESDASTNMMANAANGLLWTSAPRHGEYMKFTPFDTLYAENQLQSNANAARRAVANMSNGNRSMAVANIGLLNALYQGLQGLTLLGTEKDNWDRRLQTINQHNDVDKTWDALAVQADQANMSNNQLLANVRMKTAEQQYETEKGNNASKSAALADKLGLLNKIGTENEQWKYMDRYLDSGAVAPGGSFIVNGVKATYDPTTGRATNSNGEIWDGTKWVKQPKSNGGMLTVRRKRRI